MRSWKWAQPERLGDVDGPREVSASIAARAARRRSSGSMRRQARAAYAPQRGRCPMTGAGDQRTLVGVNGFEPPTHRTRCGCSRNCPDLLPLRVRTQEMRAISVGPISGSHATTYLSYTPYNHFQNHRASKHTLPHTRNNIATAWVCVWVWGVRTAAPCCPHTHTVPAYAR